jgi:hypothetical protein
VRAELLEHVRGRAGLAHVQASRAGMPSRLSAGSSSTTFRTRSVQVLIART